MSVEFRAMTEEQLAALERPEDEECKCSLKDDPRCTLSVEEGTASVRHLACGLPLWAYPEDIFAEFPVTVEVDTCANPGGWHGMTRCECGADLIIEYDADRIS